MSRPLQAHRVPRRDDSASARPARFLTWSTVRSATFEASRPKLPGVIVAAALALVAAWFARLLGEPLARNPVMVAMLFGIVVGNCSKVPESLRPGLDFTKRYLLRIGVAMVGFRVSLQLFANLGVLPIAIAAVELVGVLLVLRWIAIRIFKLDPDLALLVAAGSAVCGAAAILAIATLTRAREQHAGIAIALITLTGTAALVLYPLAFLGAWLPGLGDRSYGVFVGASIFELAQVYGAAFAVSERALDAATLVKLSKVLMLIPLLVVLSSWRAKGPVGSIRVPMPFPWFVAAFVGIAAFNSAFPLEPELRRMVLDIDQMLFLMVMVALGLTTRLSRLGEAGGVWRLIGVGAVGLLLSTSIAYGLVAATASPTDSGETASEHADKAGRPSLRIGSFARVECSRSTIDAPDDAGIDAVLPAGLQAPVAGLAVYPAAGKLAPVAIHRRSQLRPALEKRDHSAESSELQPGHSTPAEPIVREQFEPGRSAPMRSLRHFVPITLLAFLTKEAAPMRRSEMRLDERDVTARTGAPGVREPVLREHEVLLPGQELEAVATRLIDEFAELARR